MFELQEGLVRHIESKHPALNEEERYKDKIIALVVEISECLNEWQGFKYWKKDKTPRTQDVKVPTMMEEDKKYYNPMLEEYVDGLHLVLELGLELGFKDMRYENEHYFKEETIQDQILLVIQWTIYMRYKSAQCYLPLFRAYLHLGYMLGFTDEDIEEAYVMKNVENHLRQRNGY